jgi:hypothetical protein
MADRDMLGGQIQPDGSIFTAGTYAEYIDWPCQADRATLDGDFTAGELRQIATWMDQHALRKEPEDDRTSDHRS